MQATPEGRKFSLRLAIAWLALAAAYVSALSFYKGGLLDQAANESLEALKSRHPKVSQLFDASFFYFYEDQFLPGIRQQLENLSSGSELRRIVILSSTGSTLFDSKVGKPQAREGGAEGVALRYPDPEVVSSLGAGRPLIFYRGFSIHALMPSGQYSVLYVFETPSIYWRIGGALATALLLLIAGGLGFRKYLSRERIRALRIRVGEGWGRFWRLRLKFLVTIALVNGATALIVFYSLTSLQTREETRRIERESILFSQFASTRVISDFMNFYYYYYLDRFLPEIKNTIAANENLVSIRIISVRTGNVLFDSERASSSGPGDVAAGEVKKADFPEDFLEQLKARDYASRSLPRDGQKLLSVVNAYRNENQEAIFWVEYFFNQHTLSRSIQAIRKQILVDLVPSLALGLLIAAVFAQLLILPIRRLVSALKKVTSGDYNVSVEMKRSDEIGDLVNAFNAMTDELRKKKELRKYLSDSTYRQIMSAADGPDGVRIGGTRVAATVLFTDIRDFVAHCESLDAEEVTTMLNEYFSEMVEIVYKHGGEVDKFIGDALLAVFYASDEVKTIRPREGEGIVNPPSPTETSLQAIYCALEMRERLAEYNDRRRAVGKNTLEIGVGITYGDIISGPIGSKDRMDFTVIGDVVNLASRIEKLSKTGTHTKIVFSNHVEERIRGLMEYVEHSRQKVRGKVEDVVVYELVGIRDIRVLVDNLKSVDPTLRRRSVELLGQSRNPDALIHVLGLMEDPDESTRLSSVLSASKLAGRDDEPVLHSLLRRLQVEKSEKLLSALIATFGKICTTERIFELTPFLESSNERIVANTVEALGQVRNARCSDLILPKLYSRNNRIKANAAMALFAAGHIEVIDTLKPMLMHSDSLMRSSAAFAIGELTLIAEHGSLLKAWKNDQKEAKLFLAELQECVPMLVALLKDPVQIVRRQAVIALGKIKDRSAVLPIIDMIDPTEDPKELRRDIIEALRSIGSHRLVREILTRLQA